MTDLTYSASITRADGTSIYVSIEAPATVPDVDELAEVAQMAASHANGIIKRGEQYRAARARRTDVWQVQDDDEAPS